MTQDGIRFAIDRGGTFTDVFAEVPGRDPVVVKLLSQSELYPDASREGIRRVLEITTGIEHDPDQPIDTANIQSIRMGTTIATNALLERHGTSMALVITKGFGDLLQIGDQSRPHIFNLDIQHPVVLYEAVIEVDERVRLNKSNDAVDGENAVGLTGEQIKILQAPDPDAIRPQLQALLDRGIYSIAVVFMHSYTFPAHEIVIGNLAREMGFTHVSLSSQILPMVKILPRGLTTCVDSYLTPCIDRYIVEFCSGFAGGLSEVNLCFMQSDGGLAKASDISGFKAVLSGPAGGVVGYSRTASCSETVLQAPAALIGFDMGGTSTDVSRYHGQLDHVFENKTAGISIFAPQLDINTVAAGGGSCLAVKAGILHVGPESAGASPGPVCYGWGGPLTITDANLILGRIIPDRFPQIFGPDNDEPLNVEATRQKFILMKQENPSQFKNMTIEQIALGFIRIANEAMSRPIRNLTQSRGLDVSEHTLACFGGAGSQHCCSIAESLGIRHIFIHRYSAILSAVGIALAEIVHERQEPCARPLNQSRDNDDVDPYFSERFQVLSCDIDAHLQAQGFDSEHIEFAKFLNLRYDGTDQATMTQHGELGFHHEFVAAYRREYGFILDRVILVDDIRVRGIAKRPPPPQKEIVKCSPEYRYPQQASYSTCMFEGGVDEFNQVLAQSIETPLYILPDLLGGQEIKGPAIIINSNSSIVVHPAATAKINIYGNVEIDVGLSCKRYFSPTICDPVLLSIFGHRFMSIAEQMGRSLQRTAISTNIKERLDFSCAVFDADGCLVANAPHLPVHLGAMQQAVKYQMGAIEGGWHNGEVILSNHPRAGGSHLPDITVITPVFVPALPQPVFILANRAHHSDIGGITPGSMPPFSKYLYEEGAAVKTFKLVHHGAFDERAIRAVMSESRNLEDCISDLHAQVAANNKGRVLVEDLIYQYGLDIVQAYMKFIQHNAEQGVRQMLCDLSLKRGLAQIDTVSSIDFMDDGSPINLSITINREAGSAIFDFSGTGDQVFGNWNAPVAITYSAIIFCLRCLVDQEIPLNDGCLHPIRVIIPEGSLLNPSDDAAVVGGNVLTSQRITDVILLAFQACAASQGCMNNLTFGKDGSFGYYETIAGGAGAGPCWHGRSAVHTHMTNTRITDPEILERRYPVLLRSFAIRKDSGGRGRFKGGDGILREIQCLEPLSISILSERRSFAPYGMNGGEPGQRGRNEIVRQSDGRTIHIGSKDTYLAEQGDTIRILTPGGGGYGLDSTKAKWPTC